MLTGEYDYSCTTEASKATADKIPGAVFEPMKDLGHFPLTENPEVCTEECCAHLFSFVNCPVFGLQHETC